MVGVEVEVLATEGVDANKPFDVHGGQAHEGAGLAAAGDHGLVHFADAVLHEPAGVKLLDLSLELGGLALPLRRRERDVFQGVHRVGTLLFVRMCSLFAGAASASSQTTAEQPVHDQIWIPPDR